MRRAFTLIELLVVLGIAALLMAILLPTLIRAREAGRRTVDLSNLHQLTSACILYANEYHGYLPVGQRTPSQFANDDYTWINYTNCWELLVSRYSVPSVACICLRDDSPLALSYGQPNTGGGAPNDTGLGWVYWGGRQDIKNGSVIQYLSPRKLGDSLSPSSNTLWTCMCEDSHGTWTSIAPHVGSGYRIYPTGAPIYPAPDGLGVGRLDGSAAFVPWGSLKRIRQADDLFYEP